MSKSPFTDAFEHHVWASLRLLDVCLELSPDQLATSVPGTYGSILDTMRHLVGADAWYLATISSERYSAIDEDAMGLAELRAEMDLIGPRWASVLAQEINLDRVVVRHRDDGSSTQAPISIRLAQALHHGTDHRSQVCTALTSLGLEPPEIDLWAFGVARGRVVETIPPS